MSNELNRSGGVLHFNVPISCRVYILSFTKVIRDKKKCDFFG